MAARAYVLLRTSPGLTQAVARSLRAHRTVRSVEMITGPYDLIALIEGETANHILTAVMQDIRPAAGIRETLTCLVVPEQP
jgi:DNA-binding Lrp family transcriptional regulator